MIPSGMRRASHPSRANKDWGQDAIDIASLLRSQKLKRCLVADVAEMTKGEVPFRVTDPERIPVRRYYDEEFYRLENEKLWPHAWQMACRLEQIANVGDYIVYENLGHQV